MYRIGEIPLLEVQSKVCTKCKTCNESAPIFWNRLFEYNDHFTRTIRDVRSYRVYPGMQKILYNTGVAVASIDHPCEVRSLHQILRPNYEIVDPPMLNIVFPKDFDI